VPRAALLALSAVALSLSWSAEGDPMTATLRPPPAVDGPALGIAAGGELQFAPDQVRLLDTMRRMGATWLRFDVSWSHIEMDRPGQGRWEVYDRLVERARARGLRMLGTLSYTPPWASGIDKSTYRFQTYPPRRAADYGRFCRAAATRYAPRGVRHWEVWNEPNVRPFFGSGPDPTTYVAMLRACHRGIKAVDPQATVITGGTAPAPNDADHIAPVDWMKALYDNGARGHFDAVGHHPYSFPDLAGTDSEWSAWHQMAGSSPSIRSHMEANGDGHKRIWATEVGVPTNSAPPGSGWDGRMMPESFQADAVRAAWREWSARPWAGGLLWYRLEDTGTSPTDREQRFGLLRADRSPKPGFAAFRRAAAEAARRVRPAAG
jgi:hypothetical protein